MASADNFVFFWGGPLSQWHAASFVVAGVQYNCAEQFMMAEKARLFGDKRAEEAIMKTSDPAEQKRLGRTVKGFDEHKWNQIARGIVTVGNLAKFGQNPDLKAYLISTGTKILVEASPHDCIWGIGLSADNPRARHPKKWRGLNWLGTCLMEVRDALR